MKRSKNTRRAGFTLIEVLLVIGILVVLGTVSVVAYTRIKAGSDKSLAQTIVNNTANAVKIYQTQMGRFPDNEEGLEALTAVPEDERLAEKWRDGGGPYLEGGSIPEDPWGNTIKYELVESDTETSGPPFHVWSPGPNGQDGDEDDIRNWSTEDTGI